MHDVIGISAIITIRYRILELFYNLIDSAISFHFIQIHIVSLGHQQHQQTGHNGRAAAYRRRNVPPNQAQ